MNRSIIKSLDKASEGVFAAQVLVELWLK